MGLGKNLSGKVELASVAEAVRELTSDRGYRERAVEFAQTIESRRYPGCMSKIADRCVELLE
jgi:UDP:flavonoid glycosyltransferase YjiC (YdhE family)